MQIRIKIYAFFIVWFNHKMYASDIYVNPQ